MYLGDSGHLTTNNLYSYSTFSWVSAVAFTAVCSWDNRYNRSRHTEPGTEAGAAGAAGATEEAEMGPVPPSYVEVLTLRTWRCDCVWIFTEGVKLNKMRLLVGGL